MKPRTWFFNGSAFLSPTWTQNGKPYQINQAIKQKWLESLPKSQTLFNKLCTWFMFPRQKALFEEIQRLKRERSSLAEEEQEEEDDTSEGDGLMTLPDDDILFPPEEF
jgi:hypothetical protein